ncbi:hypothetical protein FGIG_08737 [Fasciola gigantica]|uniref:Uncharacterized protein n=1 Tax=Fasciola gigantica TaxID=46835 RepID=A0A504ZBG4_FASGI|nr:hypothetical protein FGIG_08737 [Fasciola gigantica]
MMIRKPQLDLLTAQSGLTAERRICDYIIENINNEERMLEAVLTLEQYFSQKQSLCALSLKSTELLSHVLDQVLRKCHSLEVKTVCIRIYSRIISSDCNHILKSRLITTAEPELVHLFLSSVELQSAIWDCFAYHLMQTRKLAPIVRLLMSCVFATGWNRQKRILCMENLQGILKENPDAKMTHEDLSILLMFVLEKLLNCELREDEEITIQVLKIFAENIPPDELEDSTTLLPKHLKSVFATFIKEDYQPLFAEGRRECFHEPLPTSDPIKDDSIAAAEESNFASTMEQLNLRYCTEFANALQMCSFESKNSPEKSTLRELEVEFPSILDVFLSLFKRCKPSTTRKLLDTMQVNLLSHFNFQYLFRYPSFI